MRSKIFLEDTQWALAAAVSPEILTAARHRLSRSLRDRGSKLVSGSGGMSALLVFGGSPEEGHDLAIAISREHKATAYLLDFNDEAYSIRQFEDGHAFWQKGHPAKLLRSHGITAPGYEPLPASPVSVVGLVEHVTLAEARKALPAAKDAFKETSRGVLVKETSGTLTLTLSRMFERRSFTLFHDREDMRFWCVIWKADNKPEECFAIGRSTGSYQPIDSVLGETTVDGILRILAIPRPLLFPDGAPAHSAQDRKDRRARR